MLTRRYFVAAGAGAVASLGFPLPMLAKVTGEVAETSQGVSSSLRGNCQVYRQGQFMAELAITEISAPSYCEPRVDQYIMGFRSAQPVHLQEGSYELDHPSLGRFDVFLQPAGTLNQDQHDGCQYRACIAMLKQGYALACRPPVGGLHT